jgi:hypothetical protein
MSAALVRNPRSNGDPSGPCVTSDLFKQPSLIEARALTGFPRMDHPTSAARATTNNCPGNLQNFLTGAEGPSEISSACLCGGGGAAEKTRAERLRIGGLRPSAAASCARPPAAPPRHNSVLPPTGGAPSASEAARG